MFNKTLFINNFKIFEMKKVILSLMIAAVSLGASAQVVRNIKDSKEQPIVLNKFWDNWFIQAGAGASVYLGGQNDGKFGDRIRPVFDLGIGKWFTPSMGVRLQANFSPSMREYSARYTSPYAVDANGGITTQKFNFMNLHGDFMFNLSSAFAGYNESRVYEIIPFVGAGWSRLWYKDAPVNNEITVNAGIINKFRLSRVIDINLELRSTFGRGSMDMSTIGNSVDVPLAATLGITVRLGKKGFSHAQPADYSSYLNRIKILENDKATADANAQRLAEELEAAKNIKPNTVTVTKNGKTLASPVALFFTIGKSTLDKKELANLDFYVKNAIKADDSKNFTIIGSADKGTGSKEFNQKLSEKRMQYVYDLLVNKYGIDAKRLSKKAEGDQNNRFTDPELNRAVIVE